jgi:hypothetical protein
MKNWGPYYWGTLHIACLTAPPVLTEEHKIAFVQLVESFTKVLPCPMCQEHFARILQVHPIQDAFKSNVDLFIWSVDVHNEVNKIIGKPTMSIADAVVMWADRTGYESQEPPLPLQNALLALVLISVISISFLSVK